MNYHNNGTYMIKNEYLIVLYIRFPYHFSKRNVSQTSNAQYQNYLLLSVDKHIGTNIIKGSI